VRQSLSINNYSERNTFRKRKINFPDKFFDVPTLKIGSYSLFFPDLPAEKHVREEDALPVAVLLYGGVVHDEPGPDVQVPEAQIVVDG
jgi:hypothetical protein